MRIMKTDIDPNIVIDRLGGTKKTAELCEIEPGSVSEWRHNGIPKARAMYLKVVRPDVFEPVVEQKN